MLDLSKMRKSFLLVLLLVLWAECTVIRGGTASANEAAVGRVSGGISWEVLWSKKQRCNEMHEGALVGRGDGDERGESRQWGRSLGRCRGMECLEGGDCATDFWPGSVGGPGQGGLPSLRGGSSVMVSGLNETMIDMLRKSGADLPPRDENTTLADRMASWEGKMVSVELEQGIEMQAKLINLDEGMNTFLAGPVERYDVDTGELLGTDAEDILIKGSNVLHVALMDGMEDVNLE